MPKRNSRPTLLEVAKAAGVSITAASKVLSGSTSSVRVSKETAAHVQKVAAEMRYVGNANARSLRTRRTDTVGLVFANLGHLAEGSLFNATMLDSIAKAVFARKNRLTIVAQLDEHHTIFSLQDGRLDGIVWCKLADDPDQLKSLSMLNVPCVGLCAPPPQAPHAIQFFGCDNVAGTQLMARRMAELGHRRVLFVMEMGEETTPDALARRDGFARACADVGIDFCKQDVVVWSYECTELEAWWQEAPPHTALFGWNESIAGNILKQAARLGIRVPEDLSVVGFDSTPFCETTVPKLTAVRQPILEMASAAVEHLFKLIDGQEVSKEDVVFACSLDERESLGRAPSRN